MNVIGRLFPLLLLAAIGVLACFPQWIAVPGDWIEDQVALHDPIEQQIAEILRTRVEPQVAQDGGSITLLSYRDGVAKVRMSGACGGCPSAQMTLKRGVETTLKRYIPQLQRVEAALESNADKPFWKSMLEARGTKFRSG